ncbi:MAG: hypothetical protein V8T61_00005 [Alistipes inops]
MGPAAARRGAETGSIRGEGALDMLDHAAAETGYQGEQLALEPVLRREGCPSSPCRSEWFLRGYRGVEHSILCGVGYRGALCRARAEADIAAFVRAAGGPHRRARQSLPLRRGWTAATCCGWPRPIPMPGAISVFSGGTLLADARTKLPGSGTDYPPRFPNVVAAPEATIALVDARWKEYDIGEFLPSPSDRYCRLLRGGGAEIS